MALLYTAKSEAVFRLVAQCLYLCARITAAYDKVICYNRAIGDVKKPYIYGFSGVKHRNRILCDSLGSFGSISGILFHHSYSEQPPTSVGFFPFVYVNIQRATYSAINTSVYRSNCL